jgi:hypothetical protein
LKKIIDSIKEKNIEELKILITKNQYKKQIITNSASIYILETVLEDETNEYILNFLLNQPFFNPAVDNQKYFTMCCKKGYLNYIKLFINSDKIKIDYEYNVAFRKAVEKNQIEVVKYLISTNKVNVRSKNDEASIIAVKKNFKEIINILLECDLNIVAKDNAVIRSLIKNNEIELIKKVFNNKNYKSKSTYIAAWEEAASIKNETIINYILDRNDYDLIDNISQKLIKRLIAENNIEYLKIIIKKMNKNEREKNIYFALRESCRRNKYDIFKYIVEEEKINPFTCRGKNLIISLESGSIKIFKEILKYKNYNLDKKLYYIIKTAICYERLEELSILLKEKKSYSILQDIFKKEDNLKHHKIKMLLKLNEF